jgi:hypothetical protein
MQMRLLLLVAFTAIAVLLSAGCSSADKIEQSPLATWDPSGSGFAGTRTGPGTLDISAGCVRLILENGETTLLVWPEPTSWNASSQAIEFVDVRGERAELRDGDQIIPGGGTVMRDPQFVSPPDPSCKADETFIVNSLVPVVD